MTENNLPMQPPVEEDEIDLIQLTKTLWDKRKTIIKITLLFIVIGFLVAFLTPAQYSVTSIMVPQTSGGQSKLGGLSSLAAMAGVNLNLNSGSEISPLVYPEIVKSVPFKLALMNTPLTFKGIDHPVTYYEYFTKHTKPGTLDKIKKYTIGLPGTVKKAISSPKEISATNTKNTSLIHLTKKQEELAKHLEKTVYVNVDQKTGNISLTAIMPQALAAAQLGQRAQELLQQFIIDFKIKKTKAQLKFIQSRYDVQKKKFEEAQDRLARFLDQNKNVSTAMARIKEQRLQNEYQLAYGVYSELAKQLEQAKIQVKQDTPVFSIIEPITVPTLRFKPKRGQIIIIWTFIGIVIGIGWVFGKEYFEKVKKEWKEKE